MIELSKTDKQWILLFKFHLKDKYPMKGNWIETMKPMFEELYGWSADEFHVDYCNCMFQRLLELWLKIQDDKSGTNLQLREIFSAAFYKGISDTSEVPIERAICRLAGLIQNNRVKDRYKLD